MIEIRVGLFCGALGLLNLSFCRQQARIRRLLRGFCGIQIGPRNQLPLGEHFRTCQLGPCIHHRRPRPVRVGLGQRKCSLRFTEIGFIRRWVDPRQYLASADG